MTVAVISHQKCELHQNGSKYHPEAPERLGAINNQLIAAGIDWVVSHYDAEPVTEDNILRAHDKAYLEHVKANTPNDDSIVMLDGDTGANKYSYEAALHAAGAGVMAVDLVMQGKHSYAFCATRPPGHHAKRASSAGFCIFNNIAIAAAYAIQIYQLNRIAIVDFDVHHGDGTEDILGGNPQVLFCSSFQHPYYPYSGADTDSPNIINMPMPAGTSSSVWRQVISERCLPAIKAFKPELILISAGFDSHQEDDMGGFNLLENDYAWITRELCSIAKETGQNKIISCLEGGYDLSSLGRSVVAHIKEMVEFS